MEKEKKRGERATLCGIYVTFQSGSRSSSLLTLLLAAGGLNEFHITS